MQVDGVAVDTADSVVFPENVVGRLLIVLVGPVAVSFTLFRQLARSGSIAALVGIVRLKEEISYR